MVDLSISESEKKMLSRSVMIWLEMHIYEIERYAFEAFSDEVDIEEFIEWCFDNPHTAYRIITNSIMYNDEKIDEMVKDIMHRRGKLLIVVGNKGSGKTTFGYWLAEKLHEKGETIYCFGPPTPAPDFVSGTSFDIDSIPRNVTVILDEAAVRYSSRDRNYDLITRLPTIRHSGQNFIVITQSSASIDITFLRLADGIFFKSNYIFDSLQERRGSNFTRELKIFMPTHISQVLYYGVNSISQFSFDLPDWWDEKYSTPYEPFENKGEMYKYILKILDQLPDEDILFFTNVLKHGKTDLIEISYLRNLANTNGRWDLIALSNDELADIVERGYDDSPINDLVF